MKHELYCIKLHVAIGFVDGHTSTGVCYLCLESLIFSRSSCVQDTEAEEAASLMLNIFVKLAKSLTSHLENEHLYFVKSGQIL